MQAVIYVGTDKETKRCLFFSSYQETLPAENDAVCPHLENWLCMYLDKNTWEGRSYQSQRLKTDVALPIYIYFLSLSIMLN